MRRVALALWIVLAVVVGVVVFDHAIEVGGRRYLRAAAEASNRGAYARIDDWMGPAQRTAVGTAGTACAAILAIGLIGVRYSGRRS